jgi:uncharacterized protein (TIGR02118 family)
VTTLAVTYPAQGSAKFDVDYYLATHMPLVRHKWTQHGLVSARALIPDEVGPAYLAIALLEFTDSAALDRSLASAEATDVFGDVANFTDIAPVAVRCSAR